MSYHSSFDYKCPKCGQRFISYEEDVTCPKCGYISPRQDVYDIVDKTLDAIQLHKKLYNKLVPPFFAVTSTADNYIYFASLCIEEWNRRSSIEKHITGFLRRRFDQSKEEHLIKHFQEFLIKVMKRWKSE
jgi:ribosomal protein L37E